MGYSGTTLQDAVDDVILASGRDGDGGTGGDDRPSERPRWRRFGFSKDECQRIRAPGRLRRRTLTVMVCDPSFGAAAGEEVLATVWIPGSCTGKFHYSDTTCDYGCLITEGLYWGVTSLLGAQEERCNSIELGTVNAGADAERRAGSLHLDRYDGHHTASGRELRRATTISLMTEGPTSRRYGSSGLLLLGRRLQQLHAVGSPGLLERKAGLPLAEFGALDLWLDRYDAATDTGARAGRQCAGGVPGSRRRSRPPGRPLPCLCRIVCHSCYS